MKINLFEGTLDEHGRYTPGKFELLTMPEYYAFVEDPNRPHNWEERLVRLAKKRFKERQIEKEQKREIMPLLTDNSYLMTLEDPAQLSKSKDSLYDKVSVDNSRFFLTTEKHSPYAMQSKLKTPISTV